jgi:hypothetical protein
MHSAYIFSIMIIRKMTLRKMTLSITTFFITMLCMMKFSILTEKNDTQHSKFSITTLS